MKRIQILPLERERIRTGIRPEELQEIAKQFLKLYTVFARMLTRDFLTNKKSQSTLRRILNSFNKIILKLEKIPNWEKNLVSNQRFAKFFPDPSKNLLIRTDIGPLPSL